MASAALNKITDALTEALMEADPVDVIALHEAIQEYRTKYPTTMRTLPTFARELIDAMEEAHAYVTQTAEGC